LVPGSLGAAQQLTVTSSLSQADYIDDTTPIELVWGRALDPAAERVAVFIGDADVTDLFEPTTDGLRYSPDLIPLPRDSTDLVVYRVEGQVHWLEVARFPLRVLGRLGFQPGTVDPGMTLQYSRGAAGGSASAGGPTAAKPAFDVRLSFATDHVREGLRARSDLEIVGVDSRERALRFDQLGETAPHVDLANYSLEASSDFVELAVGHLSLGTQRHLLNGFAGRGASVQLRPHQRTNLRIGLTSGSDQVGWDNPLGFARTDHRLMAASLGVDAFREAGRLRVEVTGMSGSVLPIEGFTQGALNDAERSRGGGLRLQARMLDRRLRLETGWTRSAFENPEDPELARGQPLVPVIEETRSARHLETSLDALRGWRFAGSRVARLSFGYRHERVDPQYRSVGAYAQSDRQDDRYSADLDLGGVQTRIGFTRLRNNLDNVPSILTTDTDRSEVSVRLPVSAVLGTTSGWLPTAQYRWDRTEQLGRALPVNGGFEASHLPDQVSVDEGASVDWNSSRMGFGIRWSRTLQDNRQVGRADADFSGAGRSASLRMIPWSRLTLHLDVAREWAEHRERDERSESARLGAQASLQVLPATAISLRYSLTRRRENDGARTQDDHGIDAQLSSALPGLGRWDGQCFGRFAYTRFSLLDTDSGLGSARRRWSVDVGLSLRPF